MTGWFGTKRSGVHFKLPIIVFTFNFVPPKEK